MESYLQRHADTFKSALFAKAITQHEYDFLMHVFITCKNTTVEHLPDDLVYELESLIALRLSREGTVILKNAKSTLQRQLGDSIYQVIYPPMPSEAVITAVDDK